MPRGEREVIKRNLDQAMTHIETIKQYLATNGEINRELHPEITKQYEVIYTYFEEGLQLLKALRITY